MPIICPRYCSTRTEPGLSIFPKDSSTTETNYVLYSSETFRVRMSQTFNSLYVYVRTFSLPSHSSHRQKNTVEGSDKVTRERVNESQLKFLTRTYHVPNRFHHASLLDRSRSHSYQKLLTIRISLGAENTTEA
jgi:hypothetical protein